MARSQKLSDFLGYITFQAPGVRLGLELSLCFLLFEISARILGKDSVSAQDPTLLFLWFGCCLSVGALDRLFFLPPLRILENSLKLSLSDCVESALRTFSEIAPGGARIIQFPRKLYFLQRARFFINSARFIEATAELAAARTSGTPEELCFHLELEILRAQGDFKAAKARIQHDTNPTPEKLFELAVTNFEEGHSHAGYGVNRECLREAAKLFDEIGKKAAHLSELSEAYSQSCSLWLGRAEEAFPRLLRILRSFPFSHLVDSAFNRHLGRLYLSRSYYALTHGERLLGESDSRLGSALLPGVQLKQLRKKIGEELGWTEEELREKTYPIDSVVLSSGSER